MEHFKDQIHSEFVECYPEAQNMALHDYNELLAEYLIDKLRNIEMERNNTFLRKLKRIISGWFVKKIERLDGEIVTSDLDKLFFKYQERLSNIKKAA